MSTRIRDLLATLGILFFFMAIMTFAVPAQAGEFDEWEARVLGADHPFDGTPCEQTLYFTELTMVFVGKGWELDEHDSPGRITLELQMREQYGMSKAHARFMSRDWMDALFFAPPELIFVKEKREQWLDELRADCNKEGPLSAMARRLQWVHH